MRGTSHEAREHNARTGAKARHRDAVIITLARAHLGGGMTDEEVYDSIVAEHYRGAPKLPGPSSCVAINREYGQDYGGSTMTAAETAWVAGIIEGEGYFFAKGNGGVGVRVSMTDRDIVERLKAVTGVGTLYVPRNPRPGEWKQAYAWAVQDRQDAKTLLEAILPWLGLRRTAKVEELLAQYRAPIEHVERGCSEAGCGRKHRAKGLCSTHYRRARRAAGHTHAMA